MALEKVNIGNNPFLMPMPMVIVGSLIGERPNFMAVGWASRVNARPAIMSIAIGRHATADAIRETGEYSINIPSVDLLKETDLLGIVSGSGFDKSVLFDIFYGSLKKAPMVRQCPVAIECK
ncbi:MAG: flavin reductase family protein, partial [Thermovirgaceae bacterium]|nr:flavin reductase family protein [Thermovirgaceae bacterium]